MTTSRISLRYVGALPLTFVFPTRTVTVEPGNEIELLPVEAESLAGREDFESAADQSAASTPEPDPEPVTDPDSEEIL